MDLTKLLERARRHRGGVTIDRNDDGSYTLRDDRGDKLCRVPDGPFAHARALVLAELANEAPQLLSRQRSGEYPAAKAQGASRW
jgi:hypothetical protein